MFPRLQPTWSRRRSRAGARFRAIVAGLEPLYQVGLNGVMPGGNCVANAYTNNHHRLEHEIVEPGTFIFLNVVNTVAVVHAAISRIQALMMPIQSLAQSGN
jgi:hypothetical protein